MGNTYIKDLTRLAPDVGGAQLAELGLFMAKAISSDITYAAATTGVTVFDLALSGNQTYQGMLVAGFGWKCLTEWSTKRPVVQVGTGSDADKFFTLTGADLSDANRTGFVWCMEEMIASDYTASDFRVVVTFDHGDATVTTGTMDLWMVFKPSVRQSYFVRP